MKVKLPKNWMKHTAEVARMMNEISQLKSIEDLREILDLYDDLTFYSAWQGDAERAKRGQLTLVDDDVAPEPSSAPHSDCMGRKEFYEYQEAAKDIQAAFTKAFGKKKITEADFSRVWDKLVCLYVLASWHEDWFIPLLLDSDNVRYALSQWIGDIEIPVEQNPDGTYRMITDRAQAQDR